jgi:hypothetical protein
VPSFELPAGDAEQCGFAHSPRAQMSGFWVATQLSTRGA